MKPIHFAGPSITEHEIRTVEDAMRNGWYEHAYDYCEKFQQEFAHYHDRRFGVMTPNCTSAIHLLLKALNISSGDEVILPDCTWIASAAGVTYQGATPVFADIEPTNWCIDPESFQQRITPRTKAVIVVDLYGNMPLMDDLITLAEDHHITLIEDAAEGLGSVYRGTKAGKFGIGSTFSFHRTKTITTGEGGMLLLDDENLYDRCMFLRNHGRKDDQGMYYNYEVTPKYMPFNLQAALGYAQLKRIDELLGLKRAQLEMYRDGLKNVEDIELNAEPDGGVNGAWMTTVVFGKSHQMDHRRAVQALADLEIPVRPFFYPLSSLPAYSGFRKRYEPLNPLSYDIAARGINLPCAYNLTPEMIQYICEGIKKILTKSNRKAMSS